MKTFNMDSLIAIGTSTAFFYSLWQFNLRLTRRNNRRHEENSSLHRKATTKIINAAGVATIDPRSFNSQVIGVTVGVGRIGDPVQSKALQTLIRPYL